MFLLVDLIRLFCLGTHDSVSPAVLVEGGGTSFCMHARVWAHGTLSAVAGSNLTAPTGSQDLGLCIGFGHVGREKFEAAKRFCDAIVPGHLTVM